MDERLLNRRFINALTAEEAQGIDGRSANGSLKEARQDEEALRKADNPMDAKDAIKRILLAKKDKDFFRLLELPLPELNDLDRVAWSISPAEISKAYRRLSVLVHPDKNPGDDAREAFEALNEAHRVLRDRGGLEEMLKRQEEAARQRREAAEASATPEERVALYAAKQERAKQLKKQERQSFQAEILRQMKEKQMEAKRKREIRSNYRREENDHAKAEDDDDTKHLQQKETARKPAQTKSKAKKPRCGLF